MALSRLGRIVLAAGLVLGGALRAGAAELKVELAELARILAAVADGAKLRLHNVPAGLVDFSGGSALTIAGKQVAVAIPVRTFDKAGARYAYFLNDLNSSGIAISAEGGALRLKLLFEGEGPELVGRCVAGLCPPSGTLPEVEWGSGSIAIDLVPIQLGESLSLEIRGAVVGGTFQPRCRTEVGLVASALCTAVLSQARAAIRSLKGDLDAGLKAEMNKPEMRQKLADMLQSRLPKGPAGELRIKSLRIEAGAVKVSFCLAC